MPSLFADDALLPSGWARGVLLEWDAQGRFTRVEPGRTAAEAQARASGPVLAGMTNVHSHAFQRAMAGLAEVRGHPTDDFWTWREAMYALVERIEPEDNEAVARHLYLELLKRGYTTVAEFHYLHNDREGRPYGYRAQMAQGIVNAAATTGIALTLLPVLYAHGGFGHKPLARAQRRFRSDPATVVEVIRELSQWHEPSARLRYGVAPHSVRAVDALLLTELLDSADAHDATLPIHMHVSEQAGEVAECLETHGATPLEWIAQLVPLGPRWCLIHGTHLGALEARNAAAAGACVGLCPTTEANLGDGIFDFVPWFERGARWAIGGDSHVCVSPFEELRTLECSQRLQRRVRNVAADEARPDVAANLWNGAAAGGAHAAGHSAGALEAGRRADLVVLDGGDPDFEAAGAHGALAIAVFGASRNRVRDVWVAGERMIHDGHHAGEVEALEGFRAALRRLRAAR